MFLHMLSKSDKSTFTRIACLFCISDAPALWGGKTEDEITASTDLSDISLNMIDAKQQAIEEIIRDCGISNRYELDEVKDEFANHLMRLPLARQNDIPQRQVIAVALLHQYTKQDKESSVTANKVMLFELLFLCQAGGSISPTEEALIKEFTRARGIDEFIVDEIADRAEALSRETIRALSIILE